MNSAKTLAMMVAILTCFGSAMAQEAGTDDKAAQKVPAESGNFLTLDLNYTYATKYIWRGQDLTPDNNSCNNQYTLAGSLDIAGMMDMKAGSLGSLNASIWFQTNEGNDPRTTQEIDYTVSYSYDFDEIGLSAEVGFIYYAFPGANEGNTQELYFALGLDDGKIMQAIGMGDGNPILNPTLAMYFDIDEAAGGCWTELGMSHDFVLAELGCADTAVLKDLTLGLNMTLGWACGYPEGNTAYYGNDYNSGASATYGVTADLDLQSMLSLPDFMGMNLGAFLNYTQSLDSNEPFADVLWGGVSLSVSF
jgi:hypothetical protein